MLTFIAGPPRSGTTLLTGLLSASLGAPLMAECGALAEIIRHRLTAFALDGEHQVHAFAKTEADIDAAAACYIEGLLANRDPGPLVLKSPDLCHLLPVLPRFFRRPMRTVCIVRDPRDVIASLMQVRERQGEARDLVDAADFLGGFYDDIDKALADPHPRNPVHLIRYEDMAVRNGKALAGLSAFLGAKLKVRDYAGMPADALDPGNP
ncbi:MAG TPA: sulfotransferase, partial [Caulobacteraceae bacterium]